MTLRTLLVLALLGASLLAVAAPASANPTCTPYFPPKPVPGGLVGQAWDIVASVYNPFFADVCVDPDGLQDEAKGQVNAACDLLIGAPCV